jgi:hypothetical protein
MQPLPAHTTVVADEPFSAFDAVPPSRRTVGRCRAAAWDAGIAHMIRDDNDAKTNDDGSTARAPAEW